MKKVADDSENSKQKKTDTPPWVFRDQQPKTIPALGNDLQGSKPPTLSESGAAKDSRPSWERGPADYSDIIQTQKDAAQAKKDQASQDLLPAQASTDKPVQISADQADSAEPKDVPWSLSNAPYKLKGFFQKLTGK